MTTRSPLRNWAGNVAFNATSLERPRSVEALQELVATSSTIHVVGAGHSFSPIADSPGVLVSLDELPTTIEIDRQRRRVKVSPATRFSVLAPALESEGLALANLACLAHVTVAGACATGTHGSGDDNASLSNLVAALELVAPDGELVSLERESDADELAGSVVACGALGPVSALSLDVVPSFAVRQNVYEDLAFEAATGHLDELFAEAYSVSLFVDWHRLRIDQIWRRERFATGSRDAPSALFGARAASGRRHPMPGFPPGDCTEQLGVPGPWHDRLPLFRAEVEPASAGDELQSEYLIGRRHAVEALERLARLRQHFAHLVQSSELRSVAPDRCWLSPSYDRASVAIHFTWVRDPAGVLAALPAIESELAPFGARPHWGKLFTVPPGELRERYERYADFQVLRQRRDGAGKFVNAFAERYFA